jgi:hypothetical protein
MPVCIQGMPSLTTLNTYRYQASKKTTFSKAMPDLGNQNWIACRDEWFYNSFFLFHVFWRFKNNFVYL